MSAMTVAFLTPELAKWDMLDESGAPEALVLPFFADERPLRGAAGLCDWRLCGRLSRLLARGKVSGAWQETTLYPPNSASGRRLPFPRLVLFGLGPSSEFDEPRARDAARAILAVIERLAVKRYALAPPGRSTGRLSARRALELYLAEASGRTEELMVVEALAGQKEAADLARR
jgi:Cytosol aminopeptidase family, N-terminal domain